MASDFGKFRLVQRIGGGQLSQVFQVGRADVDGDTGTALKRVNPALIAEGDFVKLVVREAGILSRLDHPNLCSCLEMGMIDGCAFLTLDLVDGCTLRALLRRVSKLELPLPTSAVLAVAAQLMRVLDYLHQQCQRPLVHLDLSPQNVMISRSGEIKLIDFGLARFCDGRDPPPLGGRMAGTIGYMSPEQSRGEEELGPPADQYGLGILLWEMLAGRRLFRGNTPKTWERMRKGDVPDPKLSISDRGDSVTHLVYRLLSPRPDDRYAQWSDALGELEASTSSLSSGKKPLAALVDRLLNDPEFDRFDAVNLKPSELDPEDIPTGELGGDGADGEEEYEEFEISVEQGEGSAAAQIRAAMPRSGEIPLSPFLEE